MFLYCGFDVSVKKSDIIGIFDIDGGAVSGATRDFLRNAEKSGRAVIVGDEIPKSFILTSKRQQYSYKSHNQKSDSDDKVYFTQLSAQSLKSRSERDMF